ncbi:membrane protein insertion efficiency factor YidD [Brachybacterium sp. EF45031]|uniref:membrane protein insertion efficiency factor YidD n=1 Tax=Brachybacterium sillae TaxID=2810536 RepID=UPI00217E8D2B|nr:membrane protein insertion efficiency factor YidD [Brachybacterium sillae]MCS6711849.1 membrane protein insertion efficiency factor YidD [Brachybacterium sillae]
MTSPRTRSPGRRLLRAPILAYQRGLSPFMPPACRFYPVCSQYAVEAIDRHGAMKGAVLAAWRILRCNPLSRGGVDLPPAPGMWRTPAGCAPTAPEALPLTPDPDPSSSLA